MELEHTLLGSEQQGRKKLTCKSLFLERSYPCCMVWCGIVTLLAIFITLMVIFLSVIPNMIQEAVDQGQISLIEMHLSNATADSVLMNVTMELTNTGSYDATIYKTTSHMYLSDGSYIGTLELPNIEVTGGEGATINLVKPLIIKNVTNFKTFSRAILSDIDTTLKLEASTTVSAMIAGSTFEEEVTLSNDLVLEAGHVENPRAYDMVVLSATNSTLTATATISFSAPLGYLWMSFKNLQLALLDSVGQTIGYAFVAEFDLKPGYNEVTGVVVTLSKTAATKDSISEFLSNYMMGIDQTLNVYGPFSGKVIDECLLLSCTAEGADFGDQIVQGMVNSGSQTGWNVTGPDGPVAVQGTYTTLKNPLDVPIRITNISTYLYFNDPLAYSFSLESSGFTDGKTCNATNMYAWGYSGYGMYKDEPDKNYVDVAAQSEESFFVIGDAIPGQYKSHDCSLFFGQYVQHHPCCFLFATTAAICRDNPQLMNDTSAQLSQSYISLNLASNTTMLIDNSFEVDLTISQDFFPLSFGEEIYQGYAGTANFNCKDNVVIN